ncbi:MAG: ThiF family adenylyltransferase [Candidatus Thorarchaeota archaeon]
MIIRTEDRYSRFRVLEGIGEAGLRRLRKARVAVVGIGGLGSVSARQLVSLGIGFLRIVDRDIVETSNLQRQLLYTSKDIGKPKVEIAKKRLNELNPDVTIETLAISLTEMNANRVVEGVDVVIDGLDSFKPRYALNRACIHYKIPYVFAGALSAMGNMTTIIPEETACLECVFGGVSDDQPTCATVGIYPTILGVIANLQVHEALQILLGQPPLLANQLLIFDINRFRLDQIPIQRYDDCSVCGVDAKISKREIDSTLEITELCTNETFLVHSNNPSPININHATELLRKDYPVIAQSDMGVQIQYSKEIVVSIVGEGNLLIKGIQSPQKAKSIYHKILRTIHDALTH